MSESFCALVLDQQDGKTLAGSTALETTVVPFVLRGVQLLGVDSVMCPAPRRCAAWERLSQELPVDAYGHIRRVTGLADVPQLAAQMMAGQARGRVVVDVQR